MTHNSQKLFTRNRARRPSSILLCALLLFVSHSTVSAQRKEEAQQPAPALTRTTSRHEVRRLGYGGSVTIIGAPAGSITVEAWPKNEVEITADVELHAATESDLALLASVNGFTVDDDVNHVRILTTGTHDKTFMRRVAKKFPKALMNLPWKIDYRIRVPLVCDLEIDAGRGPVKLSGVEGSIALKALESDATLVLTGGAVNATIGGGSVKVTIPARSWRGSGALVQLALGEMTVELPAGFSGDINAAVLRSGKVENTHEALVPQERTTFTPQAIRGRAGAGGATLTFKVTDGTILIKKQL